MQEEDKEEQDHHIVSRVKLLNQPQQQATIATPIARIGKMNPFVNNNNDDKNTARHIVVFDTMVDKKWKSQASSSTNNITGDQQQQQQQQQHFVHSQQASSSSSLSWTTNVKTFFETGRALENDDDALSWCE